MKTKLMLLIAFTLIILMNSVLAFNVYIRPPRMIARMNLTENLIYEGFLEVRNQNDIPVNISFKPIGNITDLIEFSEDLVILQPNETRDVNFTIRVNEPGYYVGNVIVTYSAENTVPVGLQAEIIVLAEGYPTRNKTQNRFLLYGAIILTVLVVVLILIKRKKRRFGR